jgi:hypothetical protein
MACKLNKPVTRETLRPCFTTRPLIITMEPGGYFTFREKGRRGTTVLTFDKAFTMAALAQARASANQAELTAEKPVTVKRKKVKVSRGLLTFRKDEGGL